MNFGSVKKIIDKAKQKATDTGKEVELTIVTNLANVTDGQIGFLLGSGCDICTSLDGPKEVHDKNRVLLEGGSSYDSVIEGIQKIRKKGKSAGALLTVTRHSLDHWKEIVDEYVRQGLRVIQLKKVDKVGNAEMTYEKINPSVEEFIDFWKRSVDYMIELDKKGVHIQERMVSIIMQKISGTPSLFSDLQSPCGAVTGQLAYTAGGKIYSCDFGRGRELFKVGDVSEKYADMISKKNVKDLIKITINEDAACDVCIYQSYCGLCPVLNYTETGNIFGKVTLTEKCQIMRSTFDYIFKALTDPSKRQVLMRWV